jgi:pyridoxine 5'-phosphate synthase PdxJ
LRFSCVGVGFLPTGAARAAFAGAGADKVTLELRQCAEHVKHQDALRRRCVG